MMLSVLITALSLWTGPQGGWTVEKVAEGVWMVYNLSLIHI